MAPIIAAHLTDDAQAFARGCCLRDPEKRPDSAELINDRFLFEEDEATPEQFSPRAGRRKKQGSPDSRTPTGTSIGPEHPSTMSMPSRGTPQWR